MQPALGPALARFEAVRQGSNQLSFMGKLQGTVRGIPLYSPSTHTHVSAHAHSCVCTRMCAHTFPTSVEQDSTVRMSLSFCSPTEGRVGGVPVPALWSKAARNIRVRASVWR